MPDEPCFNEIAIAVCASKSCEEPSFIGKGAFKEVYFTKTTDNFLVALKIFDPNKCDLCRAWINPFINFAFNMLITF